MLPKTLGNMAYGFGRRSFAVGVDAEALDLGDAMNGEIKCCSAEDSGVLGTDPLESDGGKGMDKVLDGATNVVVNSLHHQAVKRLAPGFRITAKSPKGVVEAIEGIDYPAVGLQFHPEKLFCDEDRPEGCRIFENLYYLLLR